MVMQDTKSLKDQKPEAKLKLDDDSTRFNKSLQELKDLCSQIHYAADYCETSYKKAENTEKKDVMENAKEYICRAVVTVVDHLGSVSAQLDGRVSNNTVVPETDYKITVLNQRLDALQKYSQKLSFTKLCWNTNLPRYHTRYMFPPMPSKEKPKVAREWDIKDGAKTSYRHEFETEREMPLFMYTYNHKPFLSKGLIKDTTDQTSASVLPVHDALSSQSKARNPSFDFEAKREIKRNMMTRKLAHRSIIRKTKIAV